MFHRALHLVLFVALSVSTIGCAADRKVAFDDAAFAPYDRPGTSTIAGQAFLKTRSGDVKFGAGNHVFLVPVTPYTEEDFDRAIVADEKLTPIPPDVLRRIASHCKMTIADGSGNFDFQGVGTGMYFVECPITWEILGPYGIPFQTGGMAYARATVGPGESVRVVVTR